MNTEHLLTKQIGTQPPSTRGNFGLDAAQPACAEMLGRPEAPGPDAEPGEVLVRLAEMHQFPVEHGRQTGFVHDQVSHPEIPVHQSRR